jgi:hypothetical protein
MNDKEPDYSEHKLSAGDKIQFTLVGAVAIAVALATASIAKGIGAGIAAAMIVVFLGVGED